MLQQPAREHVDVEARRLAVAALGLGYGELEASGGVRAAASPATRPVVPNLDDPVDRIPGSIEQPAGEPLGERIVVQGRVLDEEGRPIRGALVEIWQANAAGRYRHELDRHAAPLDPNFFGGGRCLTDADGRYRFVTIKPGAYPWANHENAWRPAHIHFSLFGRAFTQRLVTQMYFPDDPMFFQDPIFNAVRDEKDRQRMISRYNHEITKEQWALGFEWDIVLRGQECTPFENRQ